MLMCGLWSWRACIAVHNTLSPPPPDSANGWKKPTVSCVAGKGKEGGEGWGRGKMVLGRIVRKVTLTGLGRYSLAIKRRVRTENTTATTDISRRRLKIGRITSSWKKSQGFVNILFEKNVKGF
jgi:hypothetical protein